MILLIGLASFGLGRLSGIESARLPVTISEAASVTTPHLMNIGGQFVASRTGSVYYFPWCGGAISIPPANQIWFATEASAQKAGFSPAKNCKGLK